MAGNPNNFVNLLFIKFSLEFVRNVYIPNP